MVQYDFGMVGLGVMGRNFLLNVADHGFSAIGLDTDPAKARSLDEESGEKPVRGTTDIKDFVTSLEKPRIIMLLVPAGPVVDSVIADLTPLLEAGDLIIDGGNSHFLDTERRGEALRAQGFRFLGTGVSGGAEGARTGPSIMPGGDESAWERVRPVLEAVAAKVNGEPCVAYMGSGAAGHYVKMVHNGIEYGLMQLIAEAYDLLRRAAGMDNTAIRETFRQWNEGRLRSFLMEITVDILDTRDELAKGFLVDQILDKAKQKGTGKWTSQHAMDLGIPIPTIDAAVTMRGVSALRDLRLRAAEALPVPAADSAGPLDTSLFCEHLEKALYFSFVLTYAQGMHLLREASREMNYGLQLAEITKIWRGGCIIRAALLENMRRAYADQPDLVHLLLSKQFQKELSADYPAAREIVHLGSERAIPLLAMSSALHYYDAFRSVRLPLNLVQAQRDYFGSHTYERLDREGVFHTEAW